MFYITSSILNNTRGSIYEHICIYGSIELFLYIFIHIMIFNKLGIPVSLTNSKILFVTYISKYEVTLEVYS